MLNSFNNNMNFLSVFIDLKKAFDTMDHSIVLKKLELLGICNRALNWFTSYLHRRYQQVSYLNLLSSRKEIRAGVPKGSLLRVLIFQLHINDICASLKFINVILYADNTTLYVFGKNTKALRVKMQSDLNSVSMWLSANKLKLNIGKTKCLLFSKNSNDKIDLQLYNKKIEQVKCFKFLGFYLDSQLTFKHHAHLLHNALVNSIFAIQKLSHFVPVSCLKLLHYSHFYSRVAYGINIWFPLLKESERTLLYALQKRIVRIVNGSLPFAHCMTLFRKMKMLTLYDIVRIENAKLLYRVENSLILSSVSNLFLKVTHGYNTRRHSYEIPKHGSSKINCSFLVCSTVNWNTIPVNIRMKPSKKSFGKALRTLLISKY